MLNSFLIKAKDEATGLNLKDIMTDDESLQWEILVKAMDSIDIMNIGRDLEKISKTYQLEKWQEMSILAYVKVLEMMVKEAKKVTGGFKDIPSELKPKPDKDRPEYTGSMFG